MGEERRFAFRAKGERLMLLGRLEKAGEVLNIDLTDALFRALELGIDGLEEQAERFKRWEARERRAKKPKRKAGERG